MTSPTVVGQQAKLGVSAEESKIQRLKRQQARFRDRGGVFVPSNSNPLVDILLARTVSGESPSKVRLKDGTAKRLSSVKVRQTSPVRRASVIPTSDGSKGVAGGAKSKPRASQKRKEKAPESVDDVSKKPSPKRRGKVAKSKKKPPEQPSSKSRSMLKGRNKRVASVVASSSDANVKRKQNVGGKSNPVKVVEEVLVSDDDRTLVEAPLKAKTTFRRNIQYEGNGESDDEAPVLPPENDRQASGTTTTLRIKPEKFAGKGNSRKEMKDEETTIQNEDFQANSTKKLVPRTDNYLEDVIAPASKESKAVSSDRKGKEKAVPDLETAGPMEEVDGQPPERISKSQKRKKEGNHNERPRKAVKFTDTGSLHSSSQNLKENQSDRTSKIILKSRVNDDPDVPRSKPAPNLPSRARKFKGPPRKILERIKASAGQHLQYGDSEPDELDCLS